MNDSKKEGFFHKVGVWLFGIFLIFIVLFGCVRSCEYSEESGYDPSTRLFIVIPHPF